MVQVVHHHATLPWFALMVKGMVAIAGEIALNRKSRIVLRNDIQLSLSADKREGCAGFKFSIQLWPGVSGPCANGNR